MIDPSQSKIPISAVATNPLPGFMYPVSINFSPDDRLITYLYSPELTMTRQLFAFDPATGQTRQLFDPSGAAITEENLTLEEKLRRERQRQMGLGITRYAWNRKTGRLLIPLPNGLHVAEAADSPLRHVLTDDGGPALDARFSPDGNWIAYVQDAEVSVIPAGGGGAAHQVTSGARGSGRTNGLAEFVAQEEMARSQGYWWAPDSSRIAFTEVDESHIPAYRIMHQGKDALGAAAQEDHHYPFAGEANARVRLGVTSIEGDEPAWLDLSDDDDIYLARVDWLSDGRVAAQILNREQSQLELVAFDAAKGTRTVLVREESDVWINLHDLLRPLGEKSGDYAGGFIWGSERTGFMHLYLYDGAGALVRPLTSGEWTVESVVGVDQAAGLVYFTGRKDTPLESHLYVVPLAGGEPRRLTELGAYHGVVLDNGFKRFVDVSSSVTTAPGVTLRSLEDGALLATIFVNEDPRLAELALEPPQTVTLASRDGATLYGQVYRPDPDRFGPGPYPTIVRVYGGPHAQLVTNTWGATAFMRSQYLRDLGYLVFTLDNRGSYRRGLAFEGALRHNMGDVEVRDQVDGVNWLIAQGLADPDRVGITGWSYGGYMTLMCLARAPETFKVGVAGAPVTHWDGYDTCYTERYMGMPQSNPEGYTASSPLAHAEKIKGKLLLVHGLIDENVHFRHTARFINALIRARVPYDLLLFPDERHGPRRPADRIYLEERIRDYFGANL